MSNTSLFNSKHSDLVITNEQMSYAGDTIKFSDVKDAQGSLIKPNYAPVIAIGFIGIVLSILGKLRVGLSASDILLFETYLVIYNVWDSLGFLFCLFGMVLFIRFKDKCVLTITMNSGKILEYELTKMWDQFAIDEINKALKQAVRYNSFLVGSKIETTNYGTEGQVQ